MTRTLVTGATGTLGSAVRSRLTDEGRDVRAASRDPPTDAGARTDGNAEWVKLDLADATGIEAAVADVDVVVHCASAPTGDTEAVDVAGTKRLSDASADAGVSNLVYPSIVGIEEIPYSYYECKLRAEETLESSDAPETILRATQFHEFINELIGTVARLPIWPLPTKFRSQPVAVDEVADEIVDLATTDASGRVDPIVGPEVLAGREMATAYREARGLRRPIVRLPIPGAAARAFRAGRATLAERADGGTTWDEWLAARYGGDAPAASSAAESPS